MMLGGDIGYKYVGHRACHHILYSSVNTLTSCTNLHHIYSHGCGDMYIHSFCKNELFLHIISMYPPEDDHLLLEMCRGIIFYK